MAEKLNFEQSLERLESISQQMEAGEVSLDQAVELYAEAAKLISFCNKKLAAAQTKIEKLVETTAPLEE